MNVTNFSHSTPASPDDSSPEAEGRSMIEDLQQIGREVANLLGESAPEYGHLKEDHGFTVGYVKTGPSSWIGLAGEEALPLDAVLAQLSTNNRSRS